MNQNEMEDIYRSYEYLIKEKLAEVDWIARKMFKEMGIFSIPEKIAIPYVQQKFAELVKTVSKEGDQSNVKNYRLRTGSPVNPRFSKDIQTDKRRKVR